MKIWRLKHKKACFNNQHVFIPLDYDIFGFLTLEMVDLKRV